VEVNYLLSLPRSKNCTACHHVALLRPAALLKFGLSPAVKVLDLKGRVSAASAARRARPSFRSSGALDWVRPSGVPLTRCQALIC